MSRRYRTPRAKPGELRAAFGRVDGQLSIVYAYGGAGASSPDGRILAEALEGAIVFDGRGLVDELKRRGYDLTTLKFSIRQAAPPADGPFGHDRSVHAEPNSEQDQ